jgi:stage II sporulation protein D
MRSLAVITALLILSVASGRSESGGSDRARAAYSLFSQSAAEILASEVTSSDVSYLLLDVQTGAVLGARWNDPEKPIPLGSLVKPFTALAYGEQHSFRFPAHVCRGTATGCWLSRGHGRVDLSAAVAHSCNSYFRALTADLTGAEISPGISRFGLQAPPEDLSGPALAGLGDRWRIAPLNMARAYLELVHRRDQPGVNQIVEGMKQSAEQGTGAEVDRALGNSMALVKTGTAVCTHSRRAPGDGFTVVLTPAARPQILLMVRVHGVPGAKAATVAGEMLQGVSGKGK